MTPRLILTAALLTGCAAGHTSPQALPAQHSPAAEPTPPHLAPKVASRHRPTPAPRRSVRRARPDWQALARCESSSNPRAVSPSGRYEGLYQFDLRTWRSVGGSGRPIAASAAEQTLRAQLLYDRRGASPWPVCGRWL